MATSSPQIADILSHINIPMLGKALALLLAGYLAAKIARKLIERVASNTLSVAQAGLFGRMVHHLVFAGFLLSALSQLGFQLGMILGITGVLTLAIGFAAQTSMSNLVSGLFLLAERPFKVGDIVRIKEAQGTVYSIDWISIKLKAPDNTLIRVPNETVIKSEVYNVTRMPKRRLDIDVGVGYSEDLSKVRTVLLAIAAAEALCLDDPAPLVRFVEFGDSAVVLRLCAWCKRKDYLEMKTNLCFDIKKVFDQKKITIPFPQLTVHQETS